MSRLSREHLLGFLLDALAPDEQQQVEAELNQNPKLRDELQGLESHLRPLGMCDSPPPINPPVGLAARTCDFVAAHSAALVTPAGTARRVAEGIGLANTRLRLRELYGESASLEAGSGDGAGFTVRLDLPYRTPGREGV